MNYNKARVFAACWGLYTRQTAVFRNKQAYQHNALKLTGASGMLHKPFILLFFVEENVSFVVETLLQTFISLMRMTF